MVRYKRNFIISLTLFLLTLLLLASMVSYTPYDVRFETSSPNMLIRNYIGVVGAYVAWAIFKIVGYAGYFMPLLLLLWGIGVLLERLKQRQIFKVLGVALLFLSSATFFSLTGKDPVSVMDRGGMAGYFLSGIFLGYFGKMGSYLITVSLSVLALLVATEFLIIPLLIFLVKGVWQLFSAGSSSIFGSRSKRRAVFERPRLKPAVKVDKLERIAQSAERKEKEERGQKPKIRITPALTPVAPPRVKPVMSKKEKSEPRVVGDYKMPSLELLDLPPAGVDRTLAAEDLERNAAILEDTLMDFGIEAKVLDVSKGPVITRYELQPAPGVKVNRIVTLSDDIALAMKATSVRIEAPIPGKSRVGIEVPNQSSSLVYLREVLDGPEYQKQTKSSKLAIALGKEISGRSIVANLGDMPHLLIAGTTGSGKTVCVNSLIMSMVYNATPDELKFVMIDPKMVELAIYNGLSHLLCPVVTDAKKASAVLGWVVNQMEERYKLLAKVAARNIETFNAKSEDKLPYIVVIIDELADLMLVAQEDIENAVTRLAQLSRAVGIHLILATQRPSVDVVTGVIKANFPARISFKVASKVDSRTVLDMNGADKLLGKGDMLFIEPGNEKPIRAQGCLLTDPEIEKVVSFIKEQREPLYDGEILERQEKTHVGRGDFSKDEFFDDAVRMVLETGQASVSMLQRRLRLGYTRAARLIDTMEEQGIVGPFRGSKPREILVSGYTPKEETPAGQNQEG